MLSETGKAPSVEISETDEGVLNVVLAGDWLVSTNPPSFESVRDQFEGSAEGVKQCNLQVDQMGRSDSTLGSFLLQVKVTIGKASRLHCCMVIQKSSRRYRALPDNSRPMEKIISPTKGLVFKSPGCPYFCNVICGWEFRFFSNFNTIV